MSAVSSTSQIYEVVVNQAGQYSIWSIRKPVPEGWAVAGKQGTKESCLEFISEVWTDTCPPLPASMPCS
jgi:MbtH protein